MADAITILKDNNVPHGPYTRAQVAEQLSRGEITHDSLAFIDGLSAWTPLRDVLAKVDAGNPPSPVIPAAPASTVPIGTGFGPTGPVSVGAPAPIGTGYSYAVTMQPPGHLVYGGFWLRFVALLIDCVVLIPVIIPYVVAFGFITSVENETAKEIGTILLLPCWLLAVLGQWLYFAMMESGKGQATLGKRVLDLQVTDRQGARIGFGRATGRYFGKLVSGLTLYIGFMMAGWTLRKQALHDMMADTLVVRKPKA